VRSSFTDESSEKEVDEKSEPVEDERRSFAATGTECLIRPRWLRSVRRHRRALRALPLGLSAGSAFIGTAVICWTSTGIFGYIIRKYFGESVELPDVK
jgi:hypothetical protein